MDKGLEALKKRLKKIGEKARGERLMGKGGPKFKELRVWQKGKDLAVYIYRIFQKRHLRR